MTPVFRLTLLWIVGATIFVFLALMQVGAAFYNSEYVPSNPDAFYHARRILDVVMTGQPVQQFDPRIHAPEGSWVTWPWAFDSAMAHITRWFGPFANEAEANRVLMHIPVAAGVLFVGVVLVLARLLRLPFVLTALLVISGAALPIINTAFSVGNIDHHFAEGMWTAFTICAGMWFFSEREELAPPIVLGLVLASAVGVHNSLFILQIPVALVFLLRWLQGEALPSRRSCIAFAATLALLTIAVCAPSEPWQQGFFEFYTLSWFHVYIAVCTAAFCCALAYLPRKTSTVWLVLAGATLAALPIFGVLGFAQKFMSGQLDTLETIGEVLSPYELHARFGSALSAQMFSYLLWLSVPMMLFNAWLAWKVRDSRIQFFAVAAVLGLALLQLQFRFHVFGELALLATPLLAIHLAQQRWPAYASRILAAGCVAFLVMLIPIRGNWSAPRTPGGNPAYPFIVGAFPFLREACAARPGIVLSDVNAGHWINYHSKCSVIGDQFLLTPQHEAKVREVTALRRLTPAQLLEAAQPVRYVLVYHQPVWSREEPDLEEYRSRMVPLEASLLGPLKEVPAQYRVLWSLETQAGQTYARLFEIVR